ncbi:hypothetical protein EDEG_03676 [Edhazardia aedis USNM 41457]|uniref:Uncharacterized protein n=1 Tax=Edhazardia aedis (strain USNM 41457) TaxID=1003232 RepID=J9DKD9_EDHAE|nr:hypothetical protein EDEG_03676 [Edhazardia aedis USNM 41457]|eukprot:EJW01847.1 hypothetical protein EDEG_03676 [Edhazardia aedis USNM 41457]
MITVAYLNQKEKEYKMKKISSMFFFVSASNIFHRMGNRFLLRNHLNRNNLLSSRINGNDCKPRTYNAKANHSSTKNISDISQFTQSQILGANALFVRSKHSNPHSSMDNLTNPSSKPVEKSRSEICSVENASIKDIQSENNIGNPQADSKIVPKTINTSLMQNPNIIDVDTNKSSTMNTDEAKKSSTEKCEKTINQSKDLKEANKGLLPKDNISYTKKILYQTMELSVLKMIIILIEQTMMKKFYDLQFKKEAFRNIKSHTKNCETSNNSNFAANSKWPADSYEKVKVARANQTVYVIKKTSSSCLSPKKTDVQYLDTSANSNRERDNIIQDQYLASKITKLNNNESERSINSNSPENLATKSRSSDNQDSANFMDDIDEC